MTLRRPSRLAVALVGGGGGAIGLLVVVGLGLPWWTLILTVVAIGVVVTFNA